MVTHYRNNLDRLIFWDNSTKFKSARKKIMRELTVGDFLKENFYSASNYKLNPED